MEFGCGLPSNLSVFMSDVRRHLFLQISFCHFFFPQPISLYHVGCKKYPPLDHGRTLVLSIPKGVTQLLSKNGEKIAPTQPISSYVGCEVSSDPLSLKHQPLEYSSCQLTIQWTFI